MTDIHDLINGYQDFYKKYFSSGDTLYKELKQGQSPKTLMIACSDSRVDPSIVTDARPGDIFVIRNVANLVPAYVSDHGYHGVSAALEFAVRVLEVDNIIVMGHSQCAGIRTLMSPHTLEQTDFIGNWIEIAKSAKEKTLLDATDPEDPNLLHICEQEAIQLSLANLMSFPWIKERVQAKTLTLYGWYFSVTDGSLRQLNTETNTFERIG